MATPANAKLSPAQLRKAYKQDLTSAWALSLQNHPDHTPYAYVLYGVEGGQPPRPWPCVLTDESLSQVAQAYVDQGYHDTLEEARKALRYSVADSPLLMELAESTPTVDAVVKPFAKTLDDSNYDQIVKPAIEALKELDGEGFFGSEAAREKLLLVVMIEDTGEDWVLASGKRLNPPAVFKRLEADLKIEGAFASSSRFVISKDGRFIYSAGTRRNPNGKPGQDENISEIVRYQVDGPRLKRLWVFDHPGFGDFVSAMALGPDQKSLFVLRTQMEKTLLMRFDAQTGQSQQEAQLPVDPVALALSPDGKKLALGTRKGPVLIIDSGSFELTTTHELPKLSRTIRFLGNDQLLAATDAGLMLIEPGTDKAAKPVNPQRRFYITTDSAQTLLTMCRFGTKYYNPGKEAVKEFGVHLLDLPGFKEVGTLLVPGHQVSLPTLSRDGRLLALIATEIEKERTILVVFDVQTGKEIARRKSKSEKVMEFMPDHQTLVMGISGLITTEPVEFWRIATQG